jgi:hypothetical protein
VVKSASEVSSDFLSREGGSVVAAKCQRHL